MRAMALGQLFADLKESWSGNNMATWMADRWTMIQNMVLQLNLEGLIAEEQLQLPCDKVKQ